MIDTIVLNIPQHKYRITNYQRFKTTPEELNNPYVGFKQFFNNPTAAEKLKGTYPRTTLNKRKLENGIVRPLRMEISLPKLLWNTNLYELLESHFTAILARLSARMAEMGVYILPKDLAEAEVVAFHVSRNIVLTGGYTATLAIKELAKVNLNEKLDLEKTSFRNDGSALQYYSRIHSLVFYDKINDMGKPPKRAVDKEQTPKQLALFKEIRAKKVPLEVLRMEVRLTDARKMAAVLGSLSYKENPTFRDIFRQELWQAVLGQYWKYMVIEKAPYLFEAVSSPSTIFEAILAKYPKKPAQATRLTGLLMLYREKGVREFRQLLERHKVASYWPKASKDLKLADIPLLKKHPHGFIKDIEAALEDLTPFQHVENRDIAL